MRCLYCDKVIQKETITSLLFEKDLLCLDCRNKMPIKRRYKKIDKYNVEYFYDYDSLFRNVLLQYKECHDEALKDIFLYKIKDYINVRYYGYKIIFVPSSEKKIKERGFKHLNLMFENIKLDIVEGLYMKEELIQENRNKKEREKMLNNYVYFGDSLNKVLVIDDVITTGSSILGVANILQEKVSLIKLLCLSIKSNENN